jgi:transposase InsO family protein
MNPSKRVQNKGGKRYGVSMSYTHIMPGASILAYTTPNISKEAKNRLKWFDYHRKCGNVAKTCRYFGISRKTFYYWKKRYDPKRLQTLETQSKRPKKTRTWEVRRTEEFRILSLRKKHIKWGKMKIKTLYEKKHKTPISSWKIQRVIEKHDLYYHPTQTQKSRKIRKKAKKKQRITKLKRETRTGFLIALDTMIRYWNGQKRYILTAIDWHSKIAFARMYPSHHSRHAKDFLLRIHSLMDGSIENITRDNGSEFAGCFDDVVEELRVGNYFSRVRTPTDNPVDERFNRTLNEEFIQMGNMTDDCELFNKKLIDWLIEYNFVRPHQTLDYETPVEFHYKHHKVLPMYPSYTSN